MENESQVILNIDSPELERAFDVPSSDLDDAINDWFTSQIFPNGLVCPYCESRKKFYRIEGGARYKCANKRCHRKFSITVDTIFENTNLNLMSWLAAMNWVALDPKIGSSALAREIGVTQTTAWKMLKVLKKAYLGGDKFLVSL